jgi:N-acetylmuramoyl-L-alanine amidase
MSAIWKGAYSGNFRAGRPAGQRPEAIVIHVMDGTLTGTDSWFNDPHASVSAHYGVGKSGEVHQYVKETDTAFHAGTVVSPDWPLLRPGTNPNFYTIGIEHEGRGLSSDPWPEAQLAASAALAGDIARRWGITADARHIIGHHMIRASKPDCPGRGLNLPAYIARVAALTGTAPAPPLEEAVSLGLRLVRNGNVRPVAGTSATPLRLLVAGDAVTAVAKLHAEPVVGNDLWFRIGAGEYLWAGLTDRPAG